MLRHLNPEAELVRADQGRVALDEVLGTGFSISRKPRKRQAG